MTPQEEKKLRRRLKALSGESTLDAFDRFMKHHKSTVNMLNQARGKLRKKTWHGLHTINQVAKKANVSRNTVQNDIQRGLITPSGSENINGRRCLVFTNEEVKRYVEYRERAFRVPVKRTKWEETESLLKEHGPIKTANVLGIKLKSLLRSVERHGKSFDDYEQVENERVYEVVR